MNLDPSFLSQVATSAPALNRGMAVLAALIENPPMSLDLLADRLRLPKASVFRLLSTLQKMGAVSKRMDKQYEPLWDLNMRDAVSLFRSRLEDPMARLVADINCTVEWYEPDAGGMKMVFQKNPDMELHVRVRPGFIREWNEEMDSVSCLGYAFASQAPRLREKLQYYVKNGVRGDLALPMAQRMIDAARSKMTALDSAFNSNGVRRHAAAIVQNGVFFGVLALAEVHCFAPRFHSKFPISALLKTIKQTQ